MSAPEFSSNASKLLYPWLLFMCNGTLKGKNICRSRSPYLFHRTGTNWKSWFIYLLLRCQPLESDLLRSMSPPKATEKHKKQNQPATCIICDMTIKESSDDTDGDNALFCEGDCQAWLHHKCVCMSNKLYDKLSNCDDPFYC